MSCHDANNTSDGNMWLFGGTVYESDGTTPAANVEVGILAGGVTYTTYSATNGNFWVAAAGANNITNNEWLTAEIRIRNDNGELAMSTQASSDCNSCHSGGMELTEPQP